MSALSARRLKDRSSVSAAPAGPTKPKPDKRSPSAGKENPPGPTFRTSAQKPTMRPVPRVDKAAVSSGGEACVRWSMPSVAAKGRSSSPSEFFRGASGNVGPKSRRVSVDRVERGPSPVPGLERSGSVGRSLSRGRGSGVRDLEVKAGQLGFRVRDSKIDGGKIGVRKNGISLELVEIEANLNGLNGIRSNLKNPDGVDGRVLERSNSGKSRSSDTSEKCVSNRKVWEGLKEKGLKDEGSNGGRVGVKHPSKLHEKLAFLEGKVKRIASDIKKTKEILDMNNPDASKVILSDIQEKISGIEKAMVHVSNGSGGKMLKGKEQDHQEAKVVENGHIEQVSNGKSLVKGLNREELEARLFPHHKLIRNRTAMKASSESSQGQVVETSSESKVDEKKVCPVDENPIAIEFLASLDNEQTRGTARDGQEDIEICEVQAVDGGTTARVEKSSKMVTSKHDDDLILTTDETLEESADQENRQVIIDDETEDTSIYQLNGIGLKTSTGGWFMSEGESVLLAHDDGSCTFYDIVNSEEKALYKPPAGVSPNIWRDCWIIRAHSADGCSGRYVVAASAGNTMDSGFCSWDFYAKDVRAFHIDDGLPQSRTVLGPLPDNISYRRNTLSNLLDPETQQWWYRPCGPLMVSTATCQRVVRIYDIRDGEQVMKWDVPKPVLTMDNSSPLQWRNRGKVVVADIETISVWDVNSLTPQPLLSVSSAGRKISALHVNNTDSELGGGVRQRVSSAEAEGNDGVFCTQDSINILDFRNPSGIGLKIPKLGVTAQSVFSRGDSIFLGCTNGRSGWKKQSSQVQQFSIRKQRLSNTYALPESNAHSHHTAITQVWGNSNLVMGICGLGLFVFDALKDDGVPSFTSDSGSTQIDREVIGPDDLYAPSFDYSDSRALIISRDRPALWKQLS
ncbi:hypothetical protein ACLB2K_041279 [Fragaria x ananassa]